MGAVKNHLSLADKLAIHAFMKDGVLTKVADGVFRYEGEWNEKKVADAMSEALGRVVTVSNVQSVRQELFGSLAPKVRADTDGEMHQHVVNMLARIEALEKIVFRVQNSSSPPLLL